MEDDDAEPYDAVIEKFGNDRLEAAYGEPELIRRLVNAGNLITPNAILAACYNGNGRTLEILLSARPDPDVRVAGGSGNVLGVRSVQAIF